jgi:nucleoside-diphosphate-sugar epimerase
MKVAVFGAHGYIGTALCMHLELSGHRVVRVSSRTGGFDSGSGLLLPTVSLASVDAGIYLSQSPYWRPDNLRPEHLTNVNVTSAVLAAEMVARAGGRRFVYTSTGNVYQPGFAPHAEDSPLRDDEPYAASKVRAEQSLASLGGLIEVQILRLFGVFGPGQEGRLFPRLCDLIRSGRPVTLFPGPQPDDGSGLGMSVVHVDDVTAITELLLTGPSLSPINVAHPEQVSLRTLARMIGEAQSTTPIFVEGLPPRTHDLLADTRRLENHLPRAWEQLPAQVHASVNPGGRK